MVDSQKIEERTSVLDLAAYVASFASLVGTFFVAMFFLLTGQGQNLGAVIFTYFILLLQLSGLLLGAGVPVLIQALRLRFPLSRGAAIMLAVALTGVVAEVLALVLIRPTGNC